MRERRESEGGGEEDGRRTELPDIVPVGVDVRKVGLAEDAHEGHLVQDRLEPSPLDLELERAVLVPLPLALALEVEGDKGEADLGRGAKAERREVVEVGGREVGAPALEEGALGGRERQRLEVWARVVRQLEQARERGTARASERGTDAGWPRGRRRACRA